MLIWVPEDAVLDFGGNKAFKKQPVCNKGWGPCGYACLSHEKKNCFSALQGQAKGLAEWLERSAQVLEKKSEPEPVEKKRSPNPAAANKRVTEFAQQWNQTSFANAPDDLKGAIAAVDDPVDLDQDAPELVAYFEAGKSGVELDNYEHDTVMGQIVYRHEFGHYLDYELGTKGQKNFDEALRELGYQSLDAFMKEKDPARSDEVEGKLRKKLRIPSNDDTPVFMLREKLWSTDSEKGFISDSTKGRKAFDADDAYLRKWKRDSELSYLKDMESSKDSPRVQKLLAGRTFDTLTPYEKVTLAKDFARQDAIDMFNQATMKEKRIRDDVVRDYLEEKFGDRDDVYGDLYQRAKQSGYFSEGYPSFDPENKSVRDRALPFVMLDRYEDPEVLAKAADRIRGGYLKNVRDLVGSITTNAVSEGHGDDYYASSSHLQYTEAFANLTDLHGTGGKLEQRLAETLSPKGYKFLKQELKNAGRN